MAGNAPLKFSEFRDFVRLLNENGYVLDFSNREFGEFTREVVGIDLLEEYRLSKGASLEAFIREQPRELSIRLLRAFIDEWNRTRRSVADTESLKLADTCDQKLHDLESISADNGVGERLKAAGFTSEYLDEQRRLLWEKVSSHPTSAIGTAKDLIESCCKTILEQRKIEYSNADDLPRLVDKTQSALAVNPREVNLKLPDAKIVKALLGSLAQIARSLAELRNSYGTGHGKPASYTGLSERHARLAAGSSLTLVEYLWTTHLEKDR